MEFHWLWVLAPLGFIAFWCAVVCVISLAGGWHALARDYRAIHGKPREGSFSYVNTGSVGGLSEYRGCLIVGITPSGLYLAVWFPFRLAHPPLLIPWTAVRQAETERLLWRSGLRLRIAAPEGRRERSVLLYGQETIAGVQAHLEVSLPPPLPR